MLWGILSPYHELAENAQIPRKELLIMFVHPLGSKADFCPKFGFENLKFNV
jgi:hypothetical protein